MSTNRLIHGASSLVVRGRACYSVACDAFQSIHAQQIWGRHRTAFKQGFAIFKSIFERKYREKKFVLEKRKYHGKDKV